MKKGLRQKNRMVVTNAARLLIGLLPLLAVLALVQVAAAQATLVDPDSQVCDLQDEQFASICEAQAMCPPSWFLVLSGICGNSD